MVGGAGRAVVVLGPPDAGPYAPVAFWPAAQQRSARLADIAERALAERRGVLTRGAATGTADPFPDALAFPLLVDGQLCGVVALEIARSTEAGLQTAMRQLQWGAGWLETLLRRQRATEEQHTREGLIAVIDLVAAVLDAPGFDGAARSLVTQLALRLDCDRVSLGIVRSGHARAVMLSHSAEFGRQMNLIRAIEAAMDESIDQNATIVYPPPPDAEVLVTRSHAELARVHGSDCLMTATLAIRPEFGGALTLERPGDRPFDWRAVELVESAGVLLGPLLHARQVADAGVLRHAGRRWLSYARKLFGPRHFAAKLGALAVAAIVAFLSVATGPYQVTAPSTLEGAVRRVLVAPFEGYIASASARAGDVVAKNATLATLDVRDLSLERLKWVSQHAQYARQYQEAVAVHDRSRARIAEAQYQQAEAQLALIQEQLARAAIVAPFEGIVVSGDLSQQLGGPVRRGQVLFEVAPLNAYRVVLEVDEGEITALKPGQTGALVLTAIVGESLPFTVQAITPVTVTREGRNVFRVEALLDRASGRLRPGMEGVGKIDVDRRKLVWIWTHKLVDWLRIAFWTWWPRDVSLGGSQAQPKPPLSAGGSEGGAPVQPKSPLSR